MENKVKRFIVLSDIHGNYEALKSAVSDAINNYRSQILGFIFLGDYACDYLEGHEVIELMKTLQKSYPVFAISGNREDMVNDYANRLKNNEELWSLDSTMGVPLICCQKLSQEDIDFLCSLPKNQIINIPNCSPLFLTHRMPLTQEKIEELKEKNINTILVGHTHEVHSGKYNDFTMFNPGSVAFCVMGVKGANYGILTWRNEKWNMDNKVVDYNYEKVIESLESEPLLFEKCKQFGVALKEALKTGVNVPALYIFEAKRLAKLKYENSDEYYNNSDITYEIFGNGRYGNVSPYGDVLQEKIITNDSNGNYYETYQYIKTTEGTNDKSYPIDDEIYNQALKNVLKYLEQVNNLEIEVYNGRRSH